MNATTDMIARLHDTDRQLVSIFSRTDPDRRRELITARRAMITQLWELKRHASGPDCRIEPVLKQELVKRVTALWGEVALVQATWPAATIDQYANEHRAATRKTKATLDDLFAWASRNIRPGSSSPQERRKVS